MDPAVVQVLDTQRLSVTETRIFNLNKFLHVLLPGVNDDAAQLCHVCLCLYHTYLCYAY